jgi:hypothetical protein
MLGFKDQMEKNRINESSLASKGICSMDLAGTLYILNNGYQR